MFADGTGNFVCEEYCHDPISIEPSIVWSSLSRPFVASTTFNCSKVCALHSREMSISTRLEAESSLVELIAAHRGVETWSEICSLDEFSEGVLSFQS